MMSKRIILVCFGSLLLFSSVLKAEVPVANTLYQGGTLIEFPKSGVSFTLPEQVIAVGSAANPEHELTAGLMPYAQAGDNTLYIQVGVGDLAAIQQDMGQIVTFMGESLHPLGEVQTLEGGIVFNEFEIESGHHAFMLAAVAEDDTAVILTAVATPEVLPEYKNAISELVNTLVITFDASNSRVTPSESVVNVPITSGDTDVQDDLHEIVGAWMRRSNYSSGIYIENVNKWVFSADGRVAWGSGAIIAGGTGSVSIRGGGDNPPDFGRWSVKGDLLTINWDDGTKGEWSYFVFDYYGTPVLVLKSGGSTYRYKKID